MLHIPDVAQQETPCLAAGSKKKRRRHLHNERLQRCLALVTMFRRSHPASKLSNTELKKLGEGDVLEASCSVKRSDVCSLSPSYRRERVAFLPDANQLVLMMMQGPCLVGLHYGMPSFMPLLRLLAAPPPPYPLSLPPPLLSSRTQRAIVPDGRQLHPRHATRPGHGLKACRYD